MRASRRLAAFIQAGSKEKWLEPACVMGAKPVGLDVECEREREGSQGECKPGLTQQDGAAIAGDRRAAEGGGGVG